jgi:hypothetical protein
MAAPCICPRQQRRDLTVAPARRGRQRVCCTAEQCLAGNPTWLRVICDAPKHRSPDERQMSDQS